MYHCYFPDENQLILYCTYDGNKSWRYYTDGDAVKFEYCNVFMLFYIPLASSLNVSKNNYALTRTNDIVSKKISFFCEFYYQVLFQLLLVG